MSSLYNTEGMKYKEKENLNFILFRWETMIKTLWKEKEGLTKVGLERSRSPNILWQIPNVN